PQPHMIGKELRDAALADAVEHQERGALDAAHHRDAVTRRRLDVAEPAAPCRLLALAGGIAREVGGDGMTLADFGDVRLEAALDDAARGLGRQDLAQGRAVEAQRRAEIGARGFEKRAALLDIARDVLEIGLRKHAAPLVAVEDDEVELVELDVEE